MLSGMHAGFVPSHPILKLVFIFIWTKNWKCFLLMFFIYTLYD